MGLTKRYRSSGSESQAHRRFLSPSGPSFQKRAFLLLGTSEFIRCAVTLGSSAGGGRSICIRAMSYGQPDWDRGIEA